MLAFSIAMGMTAQTKVEGEVTLGAGYGETAPYLGDVNLKINSGKFTIMPFFNIKGITHYGGVYELDGMYDSFITQGAKKYAYLEDGKLHITISGVKKEPGAKEMGDIKKFTPNYIFKHSAGQVAYYDDAAAPIYISMGGETTRLDQLNIDYDDDNYYTLDGRAVKTPGKGVYIHRGKKIIIK